MQKTECMQLSEIVGKRVDPTYSKILQARLNELLSSQMDSFPGSQPVSFESKHFQDIEREDYFVCEKSDGLRYLLFFVHSPKGPASFLFDRNQVWYYIPNLVFPSRSNETEYLKDTLMDGELVLDVDENKKSWRYLIFDLMVVNGLTIMQRSFSTRLGMLQQDVIQPFNARMRSTTDFIPFTIELKKMERSYGLHLVFDQLPKLKHKSDGIIWTPVNYPYTPGPCNKLLKWKPLELNTVDFRIAAIWSKEHKPIYSIEVLSNGVTYKFFDHFQPEPHQASEWKNNLPDGRIAEFRYDPQYEVTIIEQGYAPTIREGGWRFVRFRDDKNTANDEIVVKKIIRSIRDYVSKEQLLLNMDKVRAAWKAREKRLSLPLKNLDDLQPTKDIATISNPAQSTPSESKRLVDNLVEQKKSDSINNDHNSIPDEDLVAKRKSSNSSIKDIIEDSDVKISETKKLKTRPKESDSTLKLNKTNIEHSLPTGIKQTSTPTSRNTSDLREDKSNRRMFIDQNETDVKGSQLAPETRTAKYDQSTQSQSLTCSPSQSTKDSFEKPRRSLSNISHLLFSSSSSPMKQPHNPPTSLHVTAVSAHESYQQQYLPQQQTPVQFINFHAESRKNSEPLDNANIGNNHVLGRSESKSQIWSPTNHLQHRPKTKNSIIYNNDNDTNHKNNSNVNYNVPHQEQPTNYNITSSSLPYHNDIDQKLYNKQRYRGDLLYSEELRNQQPPLYSHTYQLGTTAYDQQRRSLPPFDYQVQEHAQSPMTQQPFCQSHHHQHENKQVQSNSKQKDNKKAKLDFILN